jgi:DNA-binding transcriptional MerR regulator
MNPSAENDPPAENGQAYTLDVVAEITGLSSQTILQYHEAGLIAPIPDSPPGASCFDDEALRTLRRIEHLRATCEMNTAGLKLLLSLTEEVERLRTALRNRR